VVETAALSRKCCHSETTINPESKAVDASFMTPLQKAIDDSQGEGDS
jgi:hypothetical protein